MKNLIYITIFLFASSAKATLITYNDIGTWNSAATGIVTNDFNHYTNIQSFGTSHTENGVTYTGGSLFGQGNNGYAGAQWIGEKWFSFERNTPYGIDFGQSLTALSFNFADYYNTNMDLTLLFNTGESVSINQGGSNQLGFIGITTDNAFTSVQLISSNTQGPYFGIDNLSYGSKVSSVPEPSSVALLALSVLGLSFSRRKTAR